MKSAAKKSFFAITTAICAQCVRLQEEIRRLREENRRLKALLRYQQRKIDEGYFGSSTPSSKKPFKANTKAAPKNGGAQKGHPGHGRTAISEAEADEVIVLDTEQVCPHCHIDLESLDVPERTVIEVVPARVKRTLFKLKRRRCPSCDRVFAAKVPGVLPKCKQGNSLLRPASKKQKEAERGWRTSRPSIIFIRSPSGNWRSASASATAA